MLQTIKHHYRKLPRFHKKLLGILLFLGIFVGTYRFMFAGNLPFEDQLPTIFAGQGFDTGNYSTVHFAYGGNNFAGLIFWLDPEVLSTPQNITIGGPGGQSIDCSTQLKGVYYDNQRGRRLWPLDTGSQAILSGQGSGYDIMTMTGGLFTNCTGVSGYSPNSDEVYGQIDHTRSGIEFHFIAGVGYDFPINQMDGNSTFSGSLRFVAGAMTGHIRDNYGGIADITLGGINYCGDSTINTGEQCDDGNSVDNDGCDVSCMIEQPNCSDLLTYPTTGDADYPMTFALSGNRGNGISLIAFIGTSGETFSTGWVTTGTTSYDHTFTGVGTHEGQYGWISNYSGDIGGVCDWETYIVSGATVCQSFDTTTGSIDLGDDMDFVCTGQNASGYTLTLLDSGSTVVYTATVTTGATSYTWTTGNALPVGEYTATCSAEASTIRYATNSECTPLTFDVVDNSKGPTTCNPNFQGDVTFGPYNHVFNVGGISYYTDTTDVTVYLSVSEPVNYILTGDFLTGNIGTGVFTGVHPGTGLIYPISFAHTPLLYNNNNGRNYFYSTYQTGSCTYVDAFKRIYVDTLAPTPPTLLGPINGTGVCATSIFQLSWTGAVDTGAGIDSYHYYLYNSGLVLSGNGTATGAQVNAALLPLGTYTWNVVTTDQLGQSSTSATGSFVVGTQYCSGTCSCCLVNGVMYLSSIPSVRDADLSRAYLSDIFYIYGISTPTRVSISNGMLFVNGTGVGTGAYINPGDQLQIDLISSDEYDTTVTSVVSTSGYSMTAAYNVTTKLEDDDGTCNLSSAEELTIVNIYNNLLDQYNGDPNLLQDFLNTFQSMVQDNVDLTNDCSLQYLLELLDGDIDNDNNNIDTSIHIAPNCKEYNIGYENSQTAYYSPDMKVRYYFINRESLIRHIDYYNPGDCHINTYGNNTRSDSLNNSQKHIAPNGKIYTIAGSIGAYTSPEFVGVKYFDSMEGMIRYIDTKNPAKEIWNHQVDVSFTPITYAAPNGKEYRIYKTSRGYMSYKLMRVKYYETLSELETYITKQNPMKY